MGGPAISSDGPGTSKLLIGIDAGADDVAICAIDRDGTVIGEAGCKSTPETVLAKLVEIAAHETFVVGVEAGSSSTYLTRKLRARGITVRALQARHISAILKLTQNKTDRNDARAIAEILRLGGGPIPDVMIKSEAFQMIRSELMLRVRLVRERVAIENALRAVFRLNGGKITRPSSGTQLQASVLAEIHRLQGEGVDLSEIVTPVLEICVALRRTLEKSERRMKQMAEGIEVCRRFMAIPGVGRMCALSFYSAVEDPHRFERSSDVGAYLGLTPKIVQSGDMLRKGRISRRGNAMTRAHLVTAAKSLMQQSTKDNLLRQWAMRLAERAGRGKARVALARKMATVMLSMWKSGEAFRPQ